MIEWQGLAVFGVILILIVVFGVRNESRRSEKRAAYRERRRQYDDALPDDYPYIAGFDDDMAVVKKGPRQYGMMPMDEAKNKMPIHPATGLHPDVNTTPHVGDGHRSPHQMKRRRR